MPCTRVRGRGHQEVCVVSPSWGTDLGTGEHSSLQEMRAEGVSGGRREHRGGSLLSLHVTLLCSVACCDLRGLHAGGLAGCYHPCDTTQARLGVQGGSRGLFELDTAVFPWESFHGFLIFRGTRGALL